MIRAARLVLAVASVAALLGCGSDGGGAPPPTTLRRLGLGADRLVGSAVDVAALNDDREYRLLLAREFNYVTAEHAMKWGPIHPTEGTWNFGPADRVINFARAHGMAVKGHALVWHEQLPDYVYALPDAEALHAALAEHISGVVSRYRGDIRAWDVVNEPIALSGASLRRTVFLDLLGPDYIAEALRLAHAADPHALLYINEFGAEGLGAKSDTLYRLVEQLLQDGVPLDGVGFQMHFGYIFGAPPATVRANLQRFADLGLRVNISEMDVQIGTLPLDEPTRLAVQRQAYFDMVSACAAVDACESITFWGFTDKYSWIDRRFGYDDAPLLFDDLFAKKPAYGGVAEALRAARR
jgi:endo-1,4-beta-xylanase